MSWCVTKSVEQNEGGTIKTLNSVPVTSQNSDRKEKTENSNKAITFFIENDVLIRNTSEQSQTK